MVSASIHCPSGNGTTLAPGSRRRRMTARAPRLVSRRRGVGAWHRKPLILVADDDADARSIARTYLVAQGCRVVTAADGLAAVERATKHLPDAIVMDLAMPRVDGWEAIARLKREPRTRHIPIVALSAVQTSRDSARSVGCDAFLAKPCLPELLWWQVRVLIEDAAAIG